MVVFSAARVRTGFGMIEVIVSIVLLGIAAMSVAASATFSSRMIQESEDRESAVRVAAAVADSLTFSDFAGEDEREVGRFRVTWSADAAGVVSVTVAGRSRDTLVEFRSVQMPALEAVPCSVDECQ